jgi:hypothetical protein
VRINLPSLKTPPLPLDGGGFSATAHVYQLRGKTALVTLMRFAAAPEMEAKQFITRWPQRGIHPKAGLNLWLFTVRMMVPVVFGGLTFNLVYLILPP